MLSRINRWIVERIAKSAGDPPLPVSVQPSGLKFGAGQDETVLPWTDIRRIVAFTRTAGVGDTPCLVIEAGDGRIVEWVDAGVGTGDTATTDLAGQLGTHIALSMSPNEWRTRLLANPTDPLVLYEARAVDSAPSDGTRS